MSEQLKIKLSIANRVYPLTIVPGQEEGRKQSVAADLGHLHHSARLLYHEHHLGLLLDLRY